MSGLANAFFGLAGLLLKPFGGGNKQGPKPLLQVNRDAADTALPAQDELARRRGSAADMMNGTTGYEAGASTTGRLVVGS